MKFAAALLSTVLVVLLASCSNSNYVSDHPAGTGPFDSRGNYIEAWADNPAKWRGGDRKPTPPRTTTPPPVPVPTTPRPPQATASNQRPPQTAQARPAATPQPRPPVRPQPKVRRYTVKRGDTLSGIASRNRTTVAALRRTNGISGDLIRPGQVLRIP